MDDHPRKRIRLASPSGAEDVGVADDAKPIFGLDGTVESREEPTAEAEVPPVSDLQEKSEVPGSEQPVLETTVHGASAPNDSPDKVTKAEPDPEAIDEQLVNEIRVGITSFTRPEVPGFSGTLKKRYLLTAAHT